LTSSEACAPDFFTRETEAAEFPLSGAVWVALKARAKPPPEGNREAFPA
jgi:hypothetical protein